MSYKCMDWINSKVHKNDKGTLQVYEKDCLPFVPKRIFWITDVPKLAKRGGHAHKECQQFIFCVNGGVEVKSDGFIDSAHMHQDSIWGLYIPPMTWIDIRFIRPRSKIVVLASMEYDENDYLRDYDEYKRLQDSIQRS